MFGIRDKIHYFLWSTESDNFLYFKFLTFLEWMLDMKTIDILLNVLSQLLEWCSLNNLIWDRNWVNQFFLIYNWMRVIWRIIYEFLEKHKEIHPKKTSIFPSLLKQGISLHRHTHFPNRFPMKTTPKINSRQCMKILLFHFSPNEKIFEKS